MLLKRPDNAHCGGLWSFPGGKVEAGEVPQDAAMRELCEETGMTGENWRLLGDSQHTYPDRALHFHLFACDALDPDALVSHEVHAWVPTDELAGYPMPAANRAIAKLAVA